MRKFLPVIFLIFIVFVFIITNFNYAQADVFVYDLKGDANDQGGQIKDSTNWLQNRLADLKKWVWEKLLIHLSITTGLAVRNSCPENMNFNQKQKNMKGVYYEN